MIRLFRTAVFSSLLIITIQGFAQNHERPFIWVQQKDKIEILNKIENQTWAKSFYKKFKKRLDKDLLQYKKSPSQFLRKIPFNWSKQVEGKTPPLKTFKKFNDTNSLERYALNKYLQMGIDSGVLYFLTEDETYAQCALDILYTYIEGILQLQPLEQTGNGGWVYPNDHLREARVIGAQLPIIYDFIVPYLKKQKNAFDIGKNNYEKFSINNAQKVFLTYAKLAVEHGHTGSNWSVLESYSLVQNALALEDLELRNIYLNYYLEKGTDRQDALPDISKKYKKDGDVYPETSQYSNGVASYTTPLLYLLNKYKPSLKLGKKHYKIPFALDRWNALRYPNNEIIRFGDGHRKFGTSFVSYDMAYLLGEQDNVVKLTDKFGPLLIEAIETGKYNRAKVGRRSNSVSVYRTPLQLLWLNVTPNYQYESKKMPRTDKIAHAGLFLQRNVSSTKNPENGLMCFVGGGHMVHGHASGMDMELFGLGEVLGVDHGRGKYRTDLHENYSRLFAAHNTVIVNGASQGEGGWVSLGMNSTKLIAMEPMPLEKALSPNYSFSRTNFIDDKGDKAEATQERTMALIRTSPTTGYYMDVFRSKSALSNEYHDYLYHNIGDKLLFLNKNLELKPDKNRFMANAKSAWIYNKKFRNPGWHFFKDVKSSSKYSSDVRLKFVIKKLNDKNRFMNLFVVGNKDREYTKVMAPHTYEAPKPYDKLPTPTLVIRQNGEAWTNPFAVVYEPTFEENLTSGVISVEKLHQAGVFKGFKVSSIINDETIYQYIITQGENQAYTNKKLGLSFKGSFAVITTSSSHELQNIYIGEGTELKFKEVWVKTSDTKSMAADINFSQVTPVVNASENTQIHFKK